MNLNTLRDEAFKIACDHGFHDTELSNEHCLMLVITELSEAVEADRKGRRFTDEDKTEYLKCQKDKFYMYAYENYIKGTVEEELADAAIRLLDLAGLRKVDVKISDEEYESLINDLKPDAKNQYSFSEVMFNICECLIDRNIHDGIEDVILISIVLIKLACHVYDIDLDWHIEMKMKYNSMRENKHGKKY